MAINEMIRRRVGLPVLGYDPSEKSGSVMGDSTAVGREYPMMTAATLFAPQPGNGGSRTARRDFLKFAAGVIAGAATGSATTVQTPQSMHRSADLFKGFKALRVRTSGAMINLVVGGHGPAVLLLHGNPETHVMWHKIAPQLATKFTVVAADLRGYGDSSKPDGGDDHSNYSKRAMALDQVEVMRQLGFEKFSVVGHDRGGRVGQRLALDHSEHVTKLAVIDIVPTYTLLHQVNNGLATAFYHWFFLVQPAPFPEKMIGANVEFYLKYMMFRDMNLTDIPAWMGREAFGEYLRCYSDPDTLHATCEDYRAGESIDMQHDEQDLHQKIQCPVLVLWGKNGALPRFFNVIGVWQERAINVIGKPIGGRHFLPEEAPEETLAEIGAFLNS